MLSLIQRGLEQVVKWESLIHCCCLSPRHRHTPQKIKGNKVMGNLYIKIYVTEKNSKRKNKEPRGTS